MATHRFALSAGHRNTRRGGAWKGPEIDWTYPMTVKVKNEIIRRGGTAFIVQEEDGDSDPTFTNRGLGETAQLAENLAISRGGVDAYLSFHYGAEPIDGAFNIYPDATNLKASLRMSPLHAVDVRENNTLDIKLARVIAAHVAETGMRLRGDGTLSETKTGVALDGGWRNGELEGTVGIRATTARLILEAGNSLSPVDYALLWDKGWQAKYVSAVVDGLEEVFGKFNASITAPQEKPVVDPNAGIKRLFTVRFDLYARRSPGFWDYDGNVDNRIKDSAGKPIVLTPGVTGEVIGGPKVVEGVDWYDLKINGQGIDGTCWVQDRVLHTLDIKQEAA